METDHTTVVERARGTQRAATGPNGLVVGDIVGDYELRELLLSASEYDQFAAYDRVLGRDVTLKIVSGPAAIDQLRREARMLAPLAHPGLPAIYGYGTHGASEYLVQERIHGTSLATYRDVRATRGGFATEEVVAILAGIADALAVLHANGYVHGRLSADAVVMTSEGRIVVKDPTVVGEVVPGATGDTRQDLNALGLLAYELFTGRAWAGENVLETPMPPDAARIVRDLMSTTPEQMPRDAGVFAATLRAMHRVAQETSNKPLTIVIADDDAPMRALLIAALRVAAPHAIVHEAENGAAAVELVEKYQPELLLLDLEMPGLSGIEVCMYLRGTHARDHVAICVMSAHTAKHRSALSKLGVLDAFQKGDVAPEAMPQALGDLLRRLRLLPEPATRLDAASPLVGGRYQIGRQLGRGGMGLVYEARHVQLGRPLALKTISPQYALDAAARARFHQEARLASEIIHPNIVTVIDYGEDRHIGPFMVMELATGETLAQIARGRKLPIKRACDLLGQVCDALAQIHARGIVHGDIKAENILVVDEHVGTRRRRVAKLLDFGLARRITSMQTTSDVVTGTPHYIAPERASGAPATVASDVYALGILGYLLIAGSLPFDGDATDVMVQHVRTQPEPLSERRGEPVDPAIERLISRALSKDLHARHPSATAFRYELNNALDMLELSDRHARVAARGSL